MLTAKVPARLSFMENMACADMTFPPLVCTADEAVKWLWKRKKERESRKQRSGVYVGADMRVIAFGRQAAADQRRNLTSSPSSHKLACGLHILPTPPHRLYEGSMLVFRL